MCYIMLCMLEWMRKRKHRGGTLRTQGLRGSALRPTSTEESLKGYIFIVWECSTITSCVTMNPNMSIYRRLNPRLLVQAGMGLGLLHWANICLIYISNNSHKVPFFHNCSHTDLWPPLTQLVLWPSPIHLPSHQKWEPEWVIIDTISLPTTCSSLTSYWAWSKCIKFLLIYNSIHYCICSNKFVHDSFPPKQI